MITDPPDKHFSAIRFRHNPLSATLLRALDHVRHFIIHRKLILVGGMAIDSALRLKGLSLYEEDQIPDYDFYSQKNAEDAYALGSELCELEFPNVDVITAIHTTTMKVRIDGNVVADITYMPPAIFAKLRTLEFQGMRIIHPWMVMMDQFRSLSTPYENPPNEVIFERWKKDIARLNMLLGCYTLGDDKQKIQLQLQLVARPVLTSSAALHGWAALAFHERAARSAGRSAAVGDLAITNKTIMLPVDYCSVMTCDIAAFKADVCHTPLFSYPAYKKSKALEIFDFWGERATVDEADPSVASLTSVMYYFLHCWLLRDDKIALAGVQRTRILLAGHQPSIHPLGVSSWNTSTLYSIANILDRDRVKNWKPASQPFDNDCKVRRSFDPEQSPLFAIDARETSEILTIVSPEQLLIV